VASVPLVPTGSHLCLGETRTEMGNGGTFGTAVPDGDGSGRRGRHRRRSRGGPANLAAPIGPGGGRTGRLAASHSRRAFRGSSRAGDGGVPTRERRAVPSDAGGAERDGADGARSAERDPLWARSEKDQRWEWVGTPGTADPDGGGTGGQGRHRCRAGADRGIRRVGLPAEVAGPRHHRISRAGNRRGRPRAPRIGGGDSGRYRRCHTCQSGSTLGPVREGPGV
jgi:hypothetical protein